LIYLIGDGVEKEEVEEDFIFFASAQEAGWYSILYGKQRFASWA